MSWHTLKKMLILKILFSSSLTPENISTTCAQEEASFRWNCVQYGEGWTYQKLQWNSDSFTVNSISMNGYTPALCSSSLAYRKHESFSYKMRYFKTPYALQRSPLLFMNKARKPSAGFSPVWIVSLWMIEVFLIFSYSLWHLIG